jgi:hypothetical protein
MCVQNRRKICRYRRHFIQIFPFPKATRGLEPINYRGALPSAECSSADWKWNEITRTKIQIFNDYIVHLIWQRMSHAVSYGRFCKTLKYSTSGTCRVNFDTPLLDTTNSAYIHAMIRDYKDAATWQHRRLSQWIWWRHTLISFVGTRPVPGGWYPLNHAQK